mgnify:CR=1 FL=1
MNREKTIARVTAWGALVNLALAALKLAAGLLGRSSAMVADAVHSFSDLVSDAIVLVMVRVSSKGQDKGHDFGHGKFETLATVAVAILLFFVGVRLMVGGIGKIRLVLDGGELPSPDSIALWAAVVSIAVKEALYWWTSVTGKKVNSPAMISNAWHHRSDALSSIGSALGIGGAMLLGGKWAVLDPIVGCIISIFILAVAVKMVVPALDELTEGSLPDETEEEIERIICSVDGVENVHELKTRKNGPDIIIAAHIVVNAAMSVAVAHRLTEIAESKLREKFGQKTQISLHVEPDSDINVIEV